MIKDTHSFDKDIDVPSKRLDRIDKMEIDLANYEQMERDIEKIIEPYQLDWELDCLRLPNAIQSILERKEQRIVDLNKTIQGQEQKLEKIKKACDKFTPDHYKILLIINGGLVEE